MKYAIHKKAFSVGGGIRGDEGVAAKRGNHPVVVRGDARIFQIVGQRLLIESDNEVAFAAVAVYIYVPEVLKEEVPQNPIVFDSTKQVDPGIAGVEVTGAQVTDGIGALLDVKPKQVAQIFEPSDGEVAAGMGGSRRDEFGHAMVCSAIGVHWPKSRVL